MIFFIYNLLIYNLFYSFDSSAEDSLMIKYIAETYDQMSSFQVPRDKRDTVNFFHLLNFLYAYAIYTMEQYSLFSFTEKYH